jgi:uncharacterized protein YegJ (DUF2314 family)
MRRHDSLLPLALVATLTPALIAGCDKGDGSSSKPTTESVLAISNADPRLEAAAIEARRRWPEFVDAFTQRRTGSTYAVKTALPVKGGGSEHLWISVTAIRGGTVTGSIDNEPIQDIGYKLGDAITITTEGVEDWLVSHSRGQMIGGFSVRVLMAMQDEKGPP